MLDLVELLNHHASDKESQNSYGAVYHALLKHMRGHYFNLLEIGIGTVTPGAHSSMFGHDLPGYRPGASLRAWRDYFPHARIYGFDVQPDTMIEDARIFTALVDSTSGAQVENFFKLSLAQEFAVVIDDGSHLVEHQLATMRNLLPRVARGGYYVVEDVNRTDPGQPRLAAGDCREELLAIVGGQPFFFVSCPKADVLVISAR